MMRLISLMIATLVGFASAPAFAQEWIDFTSQKDFFSINLPGQPNVRDITYRTEYGITLPGRVYSYDLGKNRYSVTVIDYTEADKKHAELVKTCKAAGGEGDSCNDRSNGDVRGAMDYALSNYLRRDAKVTHYAYCNADRVEGHELYLTNADTSRTF